MLLVQKEIFWNKKVFLQCPFLSLLLGGKSHLLVTCGTLVFQKIKKLYERSEFNNFSLSTFHFPLKKAWVIVFILKVSVLQSMIFIEIVNCFYNIFHAKNLTKFYNVEKC